MKQKVMRGIAVAVAASLALAPVAPAAAKKKVALSSKKIVLKQGKKKKITLKNTKKKVKWSIKSGKKVVKLKSKKKNSVIIVAKKAGKAKVQAALGKKKYICNVTVKKAKKPKVVMTQTPRSTQAPVKPTPSLKPTPTLAPTPKKTLAPPVEKDKKQAEALKKLIKSVREHTNLDPDDTDPDDTDSDEENPNTGEVSTDINDTSQYGWKDGKLTELIWNNMGITGALELEAFPDLEILICSNNAITRLDVSKNQNLHELNCSTNKLVKDRFLMNDCKKMVFLDCSYNEYLKELDFSGMKELESLNCSDCAFGSLDISSNTLLTELNCSDNISSDSNSSEEEEEEEETFVLNVKQNPRLVTLKCSTLGLETLDVSKNVLLETLECDGNALETLDISANTELKKLNCESNSLVKLDTSANLKLEELDCQLNGSTDKEDNIPDILDPEEPDESDEPAEPSTGAAVYAVSTGRDADENTGAGDAGTPQAAAALSIPKGLGRDSVLKRAGFDSDDIESLQMDVRKNVNLKKLKCGENGLYQLDVSQNTQLELLDCSMNYLTELDVSNNPKLTFLNCRKNELEILDLSALEKSLTSTQLYCDKTVEIIGNDK